MKEGVVIPPVKIQNPVVKKDTAKVVATLKKDTPKVILKKDSGKTIAKKDTTKNTIAIKQD
jgi:hypothetical protein